MDQNAPQDPAISFAVPRPSKAVALRWPLNLPGDKTLIMVRLRRPTVGEVDAWQKDEARTYAPVYADDNGVLLPDAVIRALDLDDFDAISEAAVDFLPRRFQATRTVAASTPPTSDIIDNSSPAAPATASAS